MLNIHNLAISFQGEDLFKDISFRLGKGDKVGLIGNNGAGKSTLLRILNDDLKPDSGQIASEKNLKIGFLKQDIDFDFGRTVLEETFQAFTEIKKLEEKIEKTNAILAQRSDFHTQKYHDLMVEVNDLQHQFEILGGYNYKGSAERVLKGLGFKRNEFNNLTDTFSGGWRMRIELAKLLLQNNDVLLLDEPTNHLDIESILWLERFLSMYEGAVMIVSHDRMFLDNVTNRTIEISLGKIYDYPKPYSKYLEFRKELKEQQLAAQRNQQKHIEHTEKLIDKFRAKASKATMAQSLIKKLDKIERIEVDQDDNSTMTLKFPVSVVPGKIILEANNVNKNYGDKEVLQNVNLLLARDSKIAFVGQNGQGKTTLARIIVDDVDFQGHVKLGYNVQIGYFAQNQIDYLDGNKTVLDSMIDASNDKNRSKVRDILGAFLFRGDEVEKYVKVLSGGERNRLALAKLLLQPFNVLVMDEPTNHLDIKSKNILKEALKKFEGTLIVVSHDRDFLQGLTNKVYEFKDQKIKEYLGDINYYLEQRQVDDFREIEKKTEIKTEAKISNNKSYEDQKKIKSLNNKLSKIESNISELENEIKKIDFELEINYNELASNPNFFDDYQERKNRLNTLMEDWEQVQEEIDKLT